MSAWQWVVCALIVLMILVGQRRRGDYPWTPADTVKSEANSQRASYVHRVLVAFDVLCNVVLGGLSDETISARCGRWSLRTTGNANARWLARQVNGWLCRLQSDHGYQAMSGDLERAQAIVAVETAALAALEAQRPQ